MESESSNIFYRKEVGIVLFIVCLGLGFSLYFFFINTGTGTNILSPDTQVIRQEAIQNTDPGQMKDSSIQSQKIYQTQIDKELANLDKEGPEARLLLARKAASLSTARSLVFEAPDFVESGYILRELMLSQKIDIATFIAYSATLRLFDQWCFNSNYLHKMMGTVPEYLSFNKELLSKYSDQQLVGMLTYSKFGSQAMDKYEKLKQDSLYTGLSSKIDAMTLRSFADKLSLEDKEYLLKNLDQNLLLVEGSRPITFITYESGILDPMLAYALSYDIYHSYKEDVENNLIDENYQAVFDDIRKYKGTDIVSVNLTKTLASIYYIDSLKRRYGSSKDQEIKSFITDILKNIKGSKELQTLIPAYLRDGIYGDSQWETIKRNFVYLANSNLELKKYLVSIGIKDEDIQKLKPDWSTWAK